MAMEELGNLEIPGSVVDAYVRPEDASDIKPVADFSLANFPPMSPVSQVEIDKADRRDRDLRHNRIMRVAGGLGATLVATTIALGIARRPAPINAGPGISADVSVIRSGDSSLTLGPTSIDLPKAHTNFHGIDLGINIDVKKVDTISQGHKEQTAAGVLTDPKGTLTPPIERAFYWRAGEGLAGGLLALGLMWGGGLITRRRRQAKLAAEAEKIEQLKGYAKQYDDLPDEVKEQLPAELQEKDRRELTELQQKRQHRQKRNLYHRTTATLAGLGILLGAGGIYHEVDSLTPSAASCSVLFPNNSTNPLVRDILTDQPILKGACATGDLGHLAKEGVVQIAAQMERINEYWRGQANLLVNKVLPEFAASGGMDWRSDPNTVAFIQLTDVHDNRSYLKYFLPYALKALNVDFIAETGDEENFSGKNFLDNGAWQRLASALPEFNRRGEPFKVVLVAGNHDDFNNKVATKLTKTIGNGNQKKKYHPFIPLNESDGYTTTIDGITLVGIPDENRTSSPHGTVPASSNAQKLDDARQGEQLATIAKDITNKTGKEPVVAMTHEPQTGYATLVQGWAKLVLSGHWHATHPVKAIKHPDGSVSFEQALGTASGDGPNNIKAIDSKATTSAVMSLWTYNKLTQQFKEIMIIVQPNGGLPTITSVTLPRLDEAIPPGADSDLSQFAQQYDHGLLDKPGQAQNNSGSLAEKGPGSH